MVWSLVLLGVLATVPIDAQATFPGRNGQIAFALQSYPGRASVVTLRDYNLQTRRVRRLTAPTCRLGDSYWQDQAPDYSPDGRQIAYLHDDGCPGADDRRGIWVARADGSRRRRIAPLPAIPPYHVEPASVAFSPDGRRIVVAYRVSETRESLPSLYLHEVISLADGALLQRYQRRVSEDLVFGDIDWSSTGWLAVTMNGSVRMLRPDGTGHRVLTRSVSDASPDWSPSGRTIVYVRDREQCEESCYRNGWIQRISTSTGRSSVRLRDYSYSPVISPEGSRIAYTDGYALYSLGAKRGRPRRLRRFFPTSFGPLVRDIDWQPRPLRRREHR
jgi:Tol biopolymer transport system component